MAGSGADDEGSKAMRGEEIGDGSRGRVRDAVDSVNVHVSDGELNPSPIACGGGSRSGSSSSSALSDTSDDDRRGRTSASAVVVKSGGMRAAVAAIEASS